MRTMFKELTQHDELSKKLERLTSYESTGLTPDLIKALPQEIKEDVLQWLDSSGQTACRDLLEENWNPMEMVSRLMYAFGTTPEAN